jgi:hypothetical protein
MTEADALAMIKSAVHEVKPGAGEQLTLESDLVTDEILDSLDVMAFLFEIETMRGAKFVEINETYADFRVSTLIQMLMA